MTLHCAICGSRVVELDTAYRCEAERVRWEKTETALVEYSHRYPPRPLRPRDARTGRYLPVGA